MQGLPGHTPQWKMPKISNAYMLVYVRESAIPEINVDASGEDIAEHLRRTLEKEHEEKARKKQERLEAHLYTVARVAQASSRAARPAPARLVAVSKTKPVPQLMECYDAGHRDFGENYVQEIVEKAAVMPADVRWRFIGHVQSNKAKALVKGVPGLVAVESVDSVKLANKLDAAVRESAEARMKAFKAAQKKRAGGKKSDEDDEKSAPKRPRYGAVRYGAVRCGSVRCGSVRCGAVRCGAVRCGAVRVGVCGAVRHGAV